MESCAIFKSILNDPRDPAVIAFEFMNAQFPIDVVKLELTRLLIHSCGIRDKLPENLVTSENFDGILDFIDDKFRDVRESSIPLSNSKYFKRCVSFFERIFVQDWNTFTNEGRFDSYVARMLEGFSMWDPKQLHAVCFAIRLKFVTAYLRRAGAEDDRRCLPEVKKYGAEMLQKAIFYKTVQCSISAATELYEWIKMDASFATDRNMRMVAWSIKMDKSTQVNHALMISYSLLRMEHLRENLTLFVRKLVEIFEDLCFTENYHVFDWICRCSEFIYKYHREAISEAFMGDLLDNLFAKDRQRAKSAAGFWISSVFDANCHRTNFRIIVNFLADKGQEHWKVLVDSIIDDYHAIIEWKMLVKILLDEDDGVTEENKLTGLEKEGLIRLMAYAVEESVNGFPPEYRADNMKTLSLAVCHNMACEVTDALIPCFWKLYHAEYANNERAQIMLIYTAKFFNFAIIERQTMIALIQECVTMFKTSHQPFCYKVVIDMLRLVVSNVRDEEVAELCNSVFHVFKDYCESQMISLVEDFNNDPNKYTDLDATSVEAAEAILLRILSLNRIMILNRNCAFGIPLQMLRYETPPTNPVLMCILYVCVGLMCEHVAFSIAYVKKLGEREESPPDSYEEEYANVLDDVDVAIKTLCIKLKDWYAWPNLSIAAFFNLCKLLETVRTLPLEQNLWNNLVPADARYLMAGYVAHMVWKTDAVWGDVVKVNVETKTWILDAFLKLMECKALPLFYAYDVMTCLHKQPDVIEKPLRRFVSELCAVEEEATVVDWLVKWTTCLFILSSKDCLDVIADFVELIYPLRKQMQNIIYLVNRRGIDFALSESDQEGENSPVSRHEFLNVLVKLCECLDVSKKTAIEQYLKENTFRKEDVKVLKSFVRRLKKNTSVRKVEKSTPISKPEQMSSPILSSRRSSFIEWDENMPIWSPSSVSGSSSSSVLADESDLETGCSSVKSLVMVRSSDKNDGVANIADVVRGRMRIDEISNDVPFVFSAPSKDLDARAETASLLYSNVSELRKSLQMAMSRSSSGSGGDVGSVLRDPTIPSTSTKERDRPIESTSQAYGSISELVNELQMTSVDNGMAKSPPTLVSGGDTSDVLKDILLPSTSTKEPDRPVESTSQAYGSIGELVDELQMTSFNNVMDVNSPMSVSEGDTGDALKDPPVPLISTKEPDSHTDGTSQPHINVSELLKSPRKASVDDDALTKSLTESSGDAGYVVTDPSIPSTPMTEPEIDIESSTQVYGNVDNLLDLVDEYATAKSPAVSVSSDVANPTGDVSKSPPILSTLTKERDTEAENLSQVYGDISELLKNLQPSTEMDEFAAAKSPSMSESSGDVGGFSKDMMDVSIKDSSQHEQSGGSAGIGEPVSDVVQKLQRVSLSNTETDTSGLSSDFGKSPLKKKRRLFEP